MPSEAPEISQIRKYYGKLRFCSIEQMLHFPQNPQKHLKSNPNLSLTPTEKGVMIQKKKKKKKKKKSLWSKGLKKKKKKKKEK